MKLKYVLILTVIVIVFAWLESPGSSIVTLNPEASIEKTHGDDHITSSPKGKILDPGVHVTKIPQGYVGVIRSKGSPTKVLKPGTYRINTIDYEVRLVDVKINKIEYISRRKFRI